MHRLFRDRRLARTALLRRQVVLLCLGALGLSSACAGGSGAPASGMRRSARLNPAIAAEHDAWAALGYRISWRGFPIVARRGDGVQQFDVFREGVLVQDSRNSITFMDGRTGANLWVTDLGRPLTRFVGNVIYGSHALISSDHEIFWLDLQTGDLVDRHSLAVVVNTRPILAGNIAVYGSATGQALGHSLYSGFKSWGYQLRGSIDAAPVAMGDVVGVVSQGGDVIMIQTANGSSTGRAEIFGGLRNNPVTDGQSIFVAGLDQSVYAFASSDGRRLWRYRTEAPITAQPVWAEGVLYVEIPGQGLVAIDAISGEAVWSNTEVSGRVVCRRDDLLLVWGNGVMTTVYVETGETIDRVALANVREVRTLGFADADVYALLRDGAVVKVIAD